MSGGPAFARTYYPGVTQPDEARPVRITAGARVPDVDLRLARTRLFTLSARVPLALAAPQRGLEVVVSSLPPGTKFTRDHRAVLGDGTIRVHRLRPGRYVVWARARTTEGWSAYWDTRDVQDNTPVIDIAFAPTGRMTGRLVPVAGTLPSVDGARVIVALAIDGFEPDPLSPDQAMMAEDGSFEVDGLFGPRELRVVGLPDGWRVTDVRVGGASQTNPIPIGAGEAVADVVVVVGQTAARSGRPR